MNKRSIPSFRTFHDRSLQNRPFGRRRNILTLVFTLRRSWNQMVARDAFPIGITKCVSRVLRSATKSAFESS
jgi:hypothetical protein